MRLLFVSGRERIGAWLVESLAKEIPGTVCRDEISGSVAGLAKLREENYDLVFLSHEPPELDALQLAQAARASGADCPMIVLGNQSEQELSVVCLEHGADAYLCAHTAVVRGLRWVVTRAIEWRHLVRESRRLLQNEEQRIQREHEEVQRLLQQQAALARRGKAELAGARAHCSAAAHRLDPKSDPWSSAAEQPAEITSIPVLPLLPPALTTHYRQLLRTYVIMGSGNLARELSDLVAILCAAGISAAQALELHVAVVAELIRGLGQRSTRHVLARADLLILELMMRLADSYRTRYRELRSAAEQPFLPGLEPRMPQAA